MTNTEPFSFPFFFFLWWWLVFVVVVGSGDQYKANHATLQLCKHAARRKHLKTNTMETTEQYEKYEEHG